MNCIFCGAENPAGARFCENCDKELLEDGITEPATVPESPVKAAEEPAEEPSTPAKKHSNRLAVAAAVAVIAVAVMLIVRIWPEPAYGESKMTLLGIYDSEAGTTALVANDRVVGTVEGNWSFLLSETGGNAAALNGTARAVVWEQSLYYVCEKGVEKIADRVAGCALSADGRTVAYITEEDELMLQKVSGLFSQEAKKIADDVPYVHGELYLSPSGDTVLYRVPETEGSLSSVLYVYYAGETVELGKNLTPLGASDGGHYLYAQGGTKLYAMDMRGGKTELTSDLVSGVMFNRDLTQVKFCTATATYLSRYGGEPVKLFKGRGWLCTPPHTASLTGGVPLYDVKDLRDKVWNSEETSLVWVDKQGAAHPLTGGSTGIYTYRMSRDGKVLYYLDGNTLYKVAVTADAEPEKLAEDVTEFTLSADEQDVYMVKEDEALYHAQKGKIMENTTSLIVTAENTLLFCSGGDLYTCKGGGKAEKLAENVAGVTAIATTVYYQTEAGDVYAAKDDANFHWVAKESDAKPDIVPLDDVVIAY